MKFYTMRLYRYTYSIKEEKNELIISKLKQQDATVLWKTKVFIDSKTNFTVWDVFGRLIFEKNNKVSGLVISNGAYIEEYKKVKKTSYRCYFEYEFKIIVSLSL